MLSPEFESLLERAREELTKAYKNPYRSAHAFFGLINRMIELPKTKDTREDEGHEIDHILQGYRNCIKQHRIRMKRT